MLAVCRIAKRLRTGCQHNAVQSRPLATVVGGLIEVPVMLIAVGVVNRTPGWYEARAGLVPQDLCCPVDLSVHEGH